MKQGCYKYTQKVFKANCSWEYHPAENAEEYYRRSLEISFLDHLKGEIE